MRRESVKTVYIINKSSHDYSQAKNFGKLVFMSEGSMSRFQTSSLFRTFKPFIKNSKPDDYLLIGGLSVMCSIVCSMFAVKHGRLNLLIYKSIPYKHGTYLERIVVIK